MGTITLKNYPTATDAGIVYYPPIPAPRNGCYGCRALTICRKTVARGGYALCEQVIESELLPDAVAQLVLSRELADGRA